MKVRDDLGSLDLGALLEAIKAIEPGFYRKMNSRMHNVKKKYAGVIVAAVAVCEALGVVFG